MEKIIGLIDAPFTPMKPNGDINLEPIPAYAAMLAGNGLKGVFINGSSGEGYMLTEDERKQLAEKWMTSVPSGFKVIVHVGSCCLRESVELAHHAAEIGAWGIGYGMVDTNNMPILCQFVPAKNRATAYGLMNMTGVFMGAVITKFLGQWAEQGNLGLGFALMAAVVTVALLLQLFVLRPTSDDR